MSERSVGRLSLYRRLLTELEDEETTHVFSHQLAALAGVNAAQVRRDLMAIGYSGSPTRGYDVGQLIQSIGEFLEAPGGQRIALVGVGNLGKALLAFFAGRSPKLSIVAAFDNDPRKVDRVIHSCRCYPAAELAGVIGRAGIQIGIITVPAGAAQEVADDLVAAGVTGLLNFAPAPVRTPRRVYVEQVDVTMSLEKVAYFARQGAPTQEERA